MSTQWSTNSSAVIEKILGFVKGDRKLTIRELYGEVGILCKDLSFRCIAMKCFMSPNC